MTTTRDTLDRQRAKVLQRWGHDAHMVAFCLRELAALEDAIGPDVELSERSARFVVWFADWDQVTVAMLGSLLDDVRAAERVPV